ncbi:hypothetical protein [uncultured Cyclobacterium sp.]|uniref:hypothetical protein n=1 Tax=uncultured Cyclobacterium sp. TaxID=453820 RepID=UPI0030ECF2A8|tara:strand:- start:83553 stop:85019 length:1467 start_codon:yes stop_codon:yes gene_type:complete
MNRNLLKLSCLAISFFALAEGFSQINNLNPRKKPESDRQLNNLPVKGPYFVVDDRIIEDRWMIERFVVPLEKYAGNPVVAKEHPWEGTGPLLGGKVLFDPQDQLYKMWYSVWDSAAYYGKLPFSYNIAYAESADGIKWEKPILNVFDRKGDAYKKTNLIKLGKEKTQDIDVEFNPISNTAENKFVAIHNEAGGIFVSYSADGKTFKSSFKDPAVWYHSDTRNNFVFDEVRKRWFVYVRPKAYAGEGIKHVNRRRIAVVESDDLVKWTQERTVMVPEEGDVTDFYGITVIRRGDLFFGFLQLYAPGKTEKVTAELVWSNDSYHWYRLPANAQKSPLQLGKENEWDAGQIRIAEPVINGDEMLFYYSGNKSNHDSPGSPAIGIATTKLDRLFGARSQVDTVGRILTRPFRVNGDLFINADAAGEIRVEVRSAIRDEPLEGWRVEDCTPFRGSGLNTQISWGNKKLSDLKGKKVRLRFQLNNGTLYSFNVL